MTDIFKFWSMIGKAETNHPLDRPVFDRLNGSHGFDLRCLPCNFRSGTSNSTPADSGSRTITRRPPDGAESDEPGWVSRAPSTNVAIANIGAYHSRTFTDHHVLAALPSSRAMLDWAQSVLFPQAERGERVVICMRAVNFWGLEAGQRYGKALFAPQTTRGGHMRKGRMRELIEKSAKRHLSV